MIKFDTETVVEDLWEFIPFEKKLTEFITIDKKRSLREKEICSVIEYFENKIGHAFRPKQLEILYFQIKTCTEKLLLFENKERNISLSDGKLTEVQTLQRKIKQDYENGFDYTLEHYHNSILNIISYWLDKIHGYFSNAKQNSDSPYYPNYDCPLKEVSEWVFNSWINPFISDVIDTLELLKYLQDKLSSMQTFPAEINKNHKFKWKGTPAHLAFIINLLQEKGYIEGLTPYGERNAKLLLAHFDIEGHNNSFESLGKCFQAIKKDELPINPEDAAKFLKFPPRNELKR